MAESEKISIWDFVNSISYSKNRNLLREETESEYNQFVIARAFSNYIDTIMFASDINQRPMADKQLHHDYLLGTIRPRKRFTKWPKATENKHVETIMEYYSCRKELALSYLAVLPVSEIKRMRKYLDSRFGGFTKKTKKEQKQQND